MKKLFVPITILAVALGTTFNSCNKEEDESKNIVELAQSNADLSSLVAAVERAGLVEALSDESTPLTVFAPTNAAFNEFLGGTALDDVPVETLRNLVLNHVLTRKVMSNQVATGYANTLATVTFDGNESNVDMFINTGAANGVVINGAATVQIVDQEASNGVVHVVDKVIGIPKLTAFADANPDFSILVDALTDSRLTTNYVDFLNAEGPFTVFAPNNAAFAALLTELNASSLADIDAATLEAVLKYHVVTIGNEIAGDLTEGQSVPTAQDVSFTISLMGGAKITDGAGRETNIVATDIQGGNGVVHAVDRVLLPS